MKNGEKKSKEKGKKRKKGPKLLSVQLTSSKKFCGGLLPPCIPPKYANKHHLESKIENNWKKRKKIEKKSYPSWKKILHM